MNENIVAIYCRLSKEDDDKIYANDDSESIQNQKLLLTDYALNNNFIIYKVYSDDDYKGLDRSRPAFNQMLKDAEEGMFNTILCKHQSRFTRDIEVVEKYIHGYFVEWGIRFISIVDNIDTNIKGNKKARQIHALTNEWYVEDLSDNIRTVFQKKMKDGQFLGSFAPYGYMKDPNNHHKLIIDEEAANVVREIFNLYLQGSGCSQISHKLTQKGVMTPSAYKKEKGLNFKNPNSSKYSENYGVWSLNTIKRILRSETYIGILVQGRERKVSYKSSKVVIVPRDEWIVIENSHEPIIDKDTFYTVQQLMNNKRNVHRAKNGYKGAESSHILSGKIYCLDCGSPLHRGGTGRDGVTHYMRCKLAHKTKNLKCTPHSIKLNQLTDIVENKIKSVIQTYISNEKNVSALLKEVNRQIEERNDILIKEKELSACEKKLKETSHIVAEAYGDKVKGTITESDFLMLKEVYDEDLNSIQKRLEVLQEEIKSIEIRLKSLKQIENLLSKYACFETLTHEIVNDFIDSIQVGEKDKSGQQDVIINWMF